MRVIISGGGTGGHIYPAIAIAGTLKEQIPQAEILFVGAKGKMEMEKVPAAGYPIKGLWISGLQRKISVRNLSFPLKVIHSIRKARSIIKDFRPQAAIGVGGYASGPLLYAASQAGIPCLIQEQNAYAGLTNKWLGSKAEKICVAYEGMERFFPADKLVMTGNPVRGDLLEVASKRDEAYAFFSLDPSKKTILIIGGSQGARSINESISKNLDAILAEDVQVLWQTGKNSFQRFSAHIPLEKDPRVHQTEFIYRKDLAYALADVVISRAGALSVSELCIVGKATVFVPLPHAAEDHQRKNAQALVDQNAAALVLNEEAPEKLVREALGLLKDKARKVSFEENIRKLAKPNASKAIVEEILKVSKRAE